MQLTPRNTLLFMVIIAVAVFAETSLPYWLAEHNAPAGYVFSGQVAYAPDQNMYFSFISQARDGAFLFRNKVTAIPNDPAFLNIEYWLVGSVQRLLGLSENAVYQIWRLLGMLFLVLGFARLTRATLTSEERRLTAFALFFLTGGFGFLFAFLDRLHLLRGDMLQAGIIDARYGMVPLQQLVTNPHFALPHGLLLIAYALFLEGERTDTTRKYVYSGLVFALIGLIRPYDLIPPFIIFPAYTLAVDGLKFSMRTIWHRALPLMFILPVLAYNLWLFRYHEIFKYWSLQGHNAGSLPGPLWHYLAYGVVGVLAAIRVIEIRKQGISKTGIFLLLWFGLTFIVIQVGRFLPVIGWSPQIGVYLAAPLAIAAASVRSEALRMPLMMRRVLVPILVVTLLLSNIFVVSYHARRFTGIVNTDIFYTSVHEMDAFRWLKANTRPGTVVLADDGASQRIAKYTSNSVVASHYSVTPQYGYFAQMVEKLLDDDKFLSGAEPIPAGSNIEYVFLRKGENKLLQLTGAHLQEAFSNEGVIIYKTLP
ncbi:MAG: hypothetical protein IAE95_11710 [Chitinophagaceae bacterium]|nr:hypothetical protein [Chitinophagaceae bacterium]